MIELETALDQLLARVPPLGAETVAVEAAAGRFLATKVASPLDLPPFDNSAFDGYAVRAADVVSAATDRPVWLTSAGTVAAGMAPAFEVRTGHAARIFTGAMLPAGADAVVMQEDTVTAAERPGEIGVLDPVKPWEAVRLQGEDVRRGTELLGTGTRLNAAACGLLAAVGLAAIPVGRRPVVGLLATGSELCPPGRPLPPGSIHESNRALLRPLLQSCGAEVRDFGTVPDDLDATIAALRRCFDECDALVTSGGVSVGGLDHVRAAFARLGGTIGFWKVAVKPGKPFVFGERDGRRWFGLPGNPVSSLVTAWLLVRPALLRMQGAADLAPPGVWAELAEPLRNPGHRRHFARVVLRADGTFVPVGLQGSHALAGLARANALADVPPDTTLPVGARLRVLPLP